MVYTILKIFIVTADRIQYLPEADFLVEQEHSAGERGMRLVHMITKYS